MLYETLNGSTKVHNIFDATIGLPQTAIAETICVNKSTISREIRRNSDKRDYKYKDVQAQRKTAEQST